MRVLIFYTVLALAQCTLGSQQGLKVDELLDSPDSLRIFEAKVNTTLECIRDLLNRGDESIGLPPCDPLKLEDATFDLDQLESELISGQITLKNFVGTGMTSWQLTHLKISATILPIGAKVQMKFGWPSGELVGDYDGEINALGHNFKGNGHIAGSITNIGIDINLHGTLSRIGLKKFSIKPSLEDVSLKINGLFIDGEDKSEALSEFVSNGAEWVNENQDAIDAKLSEIIMSIINKKVDSEKSLIGDVINQCL